MMKPRAILFDLDDTILSAAARPREEWRIVAAEMAVELAPLSPEIVADAITAYARTFWADPVRHKIWRMQIMAARRKVVADTFTQLAQNGTAVPSQRVMERLGDRFSQLRHEKLRLFPDALEVLGL